MNALELLIHQEIRERGPMSFAHFMELSLYHPEWGYYSRGMGEKVIGRKGDFFTSVSVGSLFGRLLAREFSEWWEEMGRPDLFRVVECGGFDGQLAHDVLQAMESDKLPCLKAIQYILVEPLPRLAELQKAKLANFSQVTWLENLQQLKSIEGIIFGNELLDAFPVHRLEFCSIDYSPLLDKEGVREVSDTSHAPALRHRLPPTPKWLRRPSRRGEKMQRCKENGEWMECALQLEGEKLKWVHIPCSEILRSSLPSYARGMTEINLGASCWVEDVAKILRRGRVLLLDYGWTDEEYFQVERPYGTIQGYRKHRLVEDVLADPGGQDLTAHVRWTPILKEAQKLGFGVEEFIQQSRWLTRIVARDQMQLSAKEIRQFNTLTHPEILGAPFRVLVLRK